MRNRIILWLILGIFVFLLPACTSPAASAEPAPLPAADTDPDSTFSVDKAINIGTIDAYLGRDDVAYIDVRMLFDPADFSAIGGDADLSRTIEGFRIVPYPYIASLARLPVPGGYEGPTLYSLAWDEQGAIAAATPNYKESDMILRELFPQDKAIFLMCGSGGYAGMMKSFLIFLGWEESRLYNIGANWSYTGDHTLELAVYPEDAGGDKVLATWRANFAYIDFARLHPFTYHRAQ